MTYFGLKNYIFLSSLGMTEGKMSLRYEDEELELKLHSSHSNKKIDISQASGGEKSKVIGCFLISLWRELVCPFRGVDEWDVFLDHANRAEMEKLMFQYVKGDKKQYFFISPQDSTMLTPEKVRENEGIVQVVTLRKN